MMTINQIRRITATVQREFGVGLRIMKEVKPVAYAQLMRQLEDDPAKWRDAANNWRGSIPAMQRKNGESMEDAWARNFDYTLDGRPHAESFDAELRVKHDTTKFSAPLLAMRVLNDCIMLVNNPGLNTLAVKPDLWGFVPGTWDPAPEDGVLDKDVINREITRVRAEKQGKSE